MARETWLKSEDPEKFAAAAIKCEHAGGYCMSDGFCHFDGVCFRTDRAAMTKARQVIEAAAELEPPDIADSATATVRRLASKIRNGQSAPYSVQRASG